ncbi:hypothetical protein A2U01_0005312 [Trifolium medium]|uniref:Uncharacterized protein n=1 Tax=Trifolium medium TaxID=97028 RepID=A0A392MAE6_9FABA|nr:hypothetical protein [Trifolium medium]
MRFQAYESSKLYKEKVKSYHDKQILNKEFKPEQMVLLFNSRLKPFPRKLKSKWSGSFKIHEVKSYGAIELEDPVSKDRWTASYAQAIMQETDSSANSRSARHNSHYS